MNNLEKESFWNSIKYQWAIFLKIIFQPLFILVIILAILTMFLSYRTTDKSLAIFLYILSGLITSIVGAVYYDNFTNISGNTILIKKGKGAVRNLFLLMDRIRNISARSKDNAADEEIRNLLGFIEKDVYNSIQEWTDVIPTLAEVEDYTNILHEKETEINDIKTLLELKNEQLFKQANETNGLKVEKEKLETEKENLLGLLQASESELNRIKHARDKAITASSTLTSSIVTSSTAGTSGVSSVFVDRSKVGVANFEGLGRDERTGQFIRRSSGVAANLVFKPSPMDGVKLTNVKICSQCGKPFTPDSLMTTDKCDICQFGCQVLK